MPVDLAIGDYVLLAKIHHQKHDTFWFGPFKVVNSHSHLVYEVEHVVSKVKHVAHADRLLYYDDKYLNLSTKLVEQILHNDGYRVVEFVVNGSVLQLVSIRDTDWRSARLHLLRYEIIQCNKFLRLLLTGIAD